MDITVTETKILDRNLVITNYLDSIKKFDVPSPDEEVALFERIKNGDKEAREKLIMGHQRLVFSFAKQYAKSSGELIDYVNEGNIGLIKAMETYDSSRGFRFMTYAQHYVRREMNYYLNTTNMLVERSNFLKINPKLKKINNDYYSENGVYPSIDELKNIFKDKYNISIKNTSDLYNMVFTSSDIPKDSEFFDCEINDEYNKKTVSVNGYNSIVEDEHTKMTVKSLLSKLTDREKDIISMLFGVGEYDHEYSVDDVAYKYKKTATCINNIKRNAIEKLQGTNIRKMAV